MAEVKIKTTDGNNAVTLAGPASGADVTLKLPTAAGSAGQYLKTDGSNGQLSFATVSTGVSSDGQRNTKAGTQAGDSFTGTDAEDNTLYGYDAGTAITSGDKNTFIGSYAGAATDEGGRNVAVGWKAFSSHTASHASGMGDCVAIGNEALKDSTAGYATTAIGVKAMENSVDGYVNTMIGLEAAKDGFQSGNGHYNIGMGYRCFNSATDAAYNVGIGGKTLEDLEGGDHNLAIGQEAGSNLTSGAGNCVYGYSAYSAATTGSYNIAIGWAAMNTGVTTGSANIGIGKNAMKAVTNGSQNIGIGEDSGTAINSGYYNTCVGVKSGDGITSGQANVCLGFEAGKGQITTQSNNLYIARNNVDQGNAEAWVVGGGGGACVQGNNSSSWTTTSDERVKKNIVDNTEGLSVIDNVKVRNFKYKQYTKDSETNQYTTPVSSEDTIDLSSFTSGTAAHNVVARQGVTETQIGVIAQELETVCPGCVETDEKGLKTVDTDELFWHMLNAIKELSTKVKALEAG